MIKRQRTARRTCNRRGHAWVQSRPFSVIALMGRWRCMRCGRYGWLTDEQVYRGQRQAKVAGLDREWPAHRIRDAVVR